MLGSEPRPPVRRRRLPDVGDAAIDLLASEVLRRRRHAPARHDELAALRSIAYDRRAVVGIDAGQRRHVAGSVDQPVEEPAHRFLRLQHRVQVAHGIAPLRAAPERKVRRLIGRKLGPVSQHEHRELRDESLRLLDRAEVPGGGMRQSRPGAVAANAVARFGKRSPQLCAGPRSMCVNPERG